MSIFRSPDARVVAVALLALGLTTIHHVYGAGLYETPWRAQVGYYAGGIGTTILALSFGARAFRRNLFGRLMLWLNTGIIVIVPATAIGVMEGGYNHLLKTIVYFVGGAEHYRQLFPAPPYEVPSDWFFEVTGILQFPVGVWAGILALSLVLPRAALTEAGNQAATGRLTSNDALARSRHQDRGDSGKWVGK